ncbi:MAG TPA: hypothetical protein VJ180_10680 [Pyrinomonadaceae bacterium]|nr:hypothetical protein [Pyrinomonadaceae bacterium]
MPSSSLFVSSVQKELAEERRKGTKGTPPGSKVKGDIKETKGT